MFAYHQKKLNVIDYLKKSEFKAEMLKILTFIYRDFKPIGHLLQIPYFQQGLLHYYMERETGKPKDIVRKVLIFNKILDPSKLILFSEWISVSAEV